MTQRGTFEYRLTEVLPEGQLSMLDGPRNGSTYSHPDDYERLNAQQRRVFDAMSDGCWHRLRELSDATGDPEASVSARIRDFRKDRFGGLTVERRRAPGGTRACEG